MCYYTFYTFFCFVLRLNNTTTYESVGPSLVVEVALVPRDDDPARHCYCGRHRHVAEEQATAWLLAVQQPAERHSACKQEAGLDDLLVYLHPLESVGSFAVV